MIEFLIGGFLGWVLPALVTAFILAITAWIIVEVANKVSLYLKRKKREYSILYKGKALSDLINNAEDPEVKKELQKIKANHSGLLMPLKENDEPDYDSICVVSPSDKTHDSVYDCSLIADDGSYRNLN